MTFRDSAAGIFPCFVGSGLVDSAQRGQAPLSGDFAASVGCQRLRRLRGGSGLETSRHTPAAVELPEHQRKEGRIQSHREQKMTAYQRPTAGT